MTADRHRTTRRGLLALAGGTVLAGCSGLPLGPSQPRVDAARLAEIAAGAVPTVPRKIPLTVGDDHVRGHVDRTLALLSRAPLPFDRGEIPNGAIREEMNDAAEDARAALERARDAPSTLDALPALREARGEGRTVATAWAYADGGLRRGDVADDAAALLDDVRAFRDDRPYPGDDPVRALLAHREVETLARTATVEDRLEDPRRRPETLVAVSEFAADVERGRAALADAAHLHDRFRADLTTARDLAGVFETALDGSFDALRAATADFERGEPVSAYVDADVAESPVRYPLENLHGDLVSTGMVTDHRVHGAVAAALLSVHRELTRLRAFEDLRGRVEGGETYAVESAADVAAFRETAVTAIETALRESNHPDLSREVLHNVAGFVERVDDDVGRHGDRTRVPVDRVHRDVGHYVWAAAVARVTPAASETVAARLAT